MVSRLFFVVLALIFVLACSKKKEPVEVGDPSGDPNVTDTSIQFDSLGSDSGKIPGLSTINFEYDRANLTTEARRLLAENAEWIKTHGSIVVQIEGHCDDRGSVEYNLALGERRANSVKSYLVSLGIDPKRMNIISYGEEKPIASGQSEESWARNRRANFVPLPQ